MLRDRLLAAPLAGLLLGALDVGLSVAAGQATPAARSAGTAIGAVVALSLIVGVPGIALSSVASRRWSASALAAWLGQRFTRDPSAPRAPVIAAHAVLLATGIVAISRWRCSIACCDA